MLRRRAPAAAAPVQVERARLGRSYASAVALGVLNPATLALFAATLPALADAGDHDAAALMVAGVFAGSVAWWGILITLVALFRVQLGVRALAASGKVLAVALAALGAAILAGALGLRF
jgi:threonine/homoserine/homoserine lactone efflux protein